MASWCVRRRRSQATRPARQLSFRPVDVDASIESNAAGLTSTAHPRLEFRVSPQERRRIEHAAKLVGEQVTTIAADGSNVSGVVQRAALTLTAASVVIGGLTGPASTAGPGGVRSSHHYGGRSLCTTRGATHSGHVFSSVRLNLFSSAA